MALLGPGDVEKDSLFSTVTGGRPSTANVRVVLTSPNALTPPLLKTMGRVSGARQLA